MYVGFTERCLCIKNVQKGMEVQKRARLENCELKQAVADYTVKASHFKYLLDLLFNFVCCKLMLSDYGCDIDVRLTLWFRSSEAFWLVTKKCLVTSYTLCVYWL